MHVSAELYFDLLRKRDRRRATALADALRPSQPLEAHLLDRFARDGAQSITIDEGVWRGRTAWIGPQLPDTNEPGQLWFDTVELTTMVSVPREPPGNDWLPEAIERWTPLLGWLSVRPVAVWQYHGYLKLAKPSGAAAISQRIARDADETAAVTCVSGYEAYAFVEWMGKWLSDQVVWQTVRERMGQETFERLWGTSNKEWCAYDSDAIALCPQTLYAFHKDEPDELRPPEHRMVYDGLEWSAEIGFRSAVLDGVGLLESEPARPRYRR